MGPLRHILTLITALLIALISAAAAPALPIPAFSGEIAGAKALSTCFVQAVRNDTQAGAPNKGNFEAAGEILGELQGGAYLTLAVLGSMSAKYGAKLQKLNPKAHKRDRRLEIAELFANNHPRYGIQIGNRTVLHNGILAVHACSVV